MIRNGAADRHRAARPSRGAAVWLLLSALLVACSANPPAPVENRRAGEPGEAARATNRPDRYTVKRGDTLYSIAFRFGMDYREVARLNRIGVPYTIYPGQTLRFSGAAAPASAPHSASVQRPAVPTETPSREPAAASPATSANSAVSSWRWPTSGKVIRKFTGSLHKGIDIDGKAGDAVVATAGGQVVYAGSGIVGYGNLLIVKHNQTYLSAYAHNRRLLVAEGATVKAGQRIAEKGNSATNAVKLHFEIRRNGKPVDPQTLLPKR
ncbi:MAG: peptidoglycan DD-metalloendopeptidase family protein [Pseudomonadota bacterium]